MPFSYEDIAWQCTALNNASLTHSLTSGMRNWKHPYLIWWEVEIFI